MKKIFYSLALAALPLVAAARPASPDLQQHVNPDGSVVEFIAHGNEIFNYLTTPDGSRLLELDANGFLTEKKVNGNIVDASEANIAPMREAALKSRELIPANGRTIHRMAALDTQGRTTYPTIGEVHALVILLEYPDTPYTMENPKEYYTNFCNEKGFSKFAAKGSAKDYYEASSNGKFSPTFDVYGPVRLEHNHQYYVGMADGDIPAEPTLPGYQHQARLGIAIEQALKELDPEINFADYDLDKDGNIDNIFFFYSGYGQADNTNKKDLIWPHQWDFINYTNAYNGTLGLERLIVDGVEMRTYACTNELNGNKSIPESQRPYVDGIGAFCHEYGHVLGLPDLYDTGYSYPALKTPGIYSVMDKGSYNSNSTCPPLFSAYEQWVCRWLDYTNAEDGQTYTLKPLSTEGEGNAVRIRVQRPGLTTFYPEYYILECRDNSGWDASLPQTGMLIWRINYDRKTWVNNHVNTGTLNVELLSVPGSSSQYTWPGEFMDRTSILPADNVLTPASYTGFNTGTPLDATISRISYDPMLDNVLTFAYNLDKPFDDVTVLEDTPKISADKSEIYLRWKPAEGATDYKLTVFRTDAKGNKYFVDGCDEKSVGTETTATLRNLDAGSLSQTYTAYVRVCKGIPGNKTSNEITFVPNRLPEGTGVSLVEADELNVFGGQGCIIAPEGAEAYNLAGMKVGTTNLPSGVYIVVLNGKSAKVVVR